MQTILKRAAGLGALFKADEGGRVPPLRAAASLLVTTALITGFFWLSLSRIDYLPDFGFLPDFKLRLADGFLLTLWVSAAAMALSLLFGTLSALGQRSRLLPVRYFCDAYVTFIRGTPLIMQIYLFFYLVGTAWGVEDRFWAGVIILSIFQGAYISEIIRGSAASIEAAQIESAKAVGFSRMQTLRYVILPQMVARTLPALAGQFASVIKDSSLLSMISVVELTQTMREISAENLRLLECYLVLGLFYLVLTLPVVSLSRALEKRFGYEA